MLGFSQASKLQVVLAGSGRIPVAPGVAFLLLAEVLRPGDMILAAGQCISAVSMVREAAGLRI